MLQTVSTLTGRRGRPRKYTEEEKEQLSRPSVRLNPEQDARLAALALAEGLTIQDTFVKLLEDAVAEHPDREYIERRVRNELAKLAGGLPPPEKPRPRKKPSQ